MVKFLFEFFVLSFTVIATQSSAINDQVCDRQLEYFDNELNAREHWALFGEIKIFRNFQITDKKRIENSVFDTWAKLPSGVFRGNLVSPGGFTDCVNFRHDSNVTGVGTIQGQHCMVDFSAKAEKTEIVSDGGFDWKEM